MLCIRLDKQDIATSCKKSKCIFFDRWDKGKLLDRMDKDGGDGLFKARIQRLNKDFLLMYQQRRGA